MISMRDAIMYVTAGMAGTCIVCLGLFMGVLYEAKDAPEEGSHEGK